MPLTLWELPRRLLLRVQDTLMVFVFVVVPLMLLAVGIHFLAQATAPLIVYSVAGLGLGPLLLWLIRWQLRYTRPFYPFDEMSQLRIDDDSLTVASAGLREQYPLHDVRNGVLLPSFIRQIMQVKLPTSQ